MRDADTAFSACASGDTLAMGISPKFWHDPVTRIYRFVPTNPKVGSHPERSPAKPSAAGRGGGQQKKGAKKVHVRDEVERLTEGRLSLPREQLDLFQRVKSQTKSKMAQEQKLHSRVTRLHAARRPATARESTGNGRGASKRSEEVGAPPAGGAILSLLTFLGGVDSGPKDALNEARPMTVAAVPPPADGSRPSRRKPTPASGDGRDRPPSAKPKADASLRSAPTWLVTESSSVSGTEGAPLDPGQVLRQMQEIEDGYPL